MTKYVFKDPDEDEQDEIMCTWCGRDCGCSICFSCMSDMTGV